MNHCPSCSSAKVSIKYNYKKPIKDFNVRCTSFYNQKPTLYICNDCMINICNDCMIIYSEFVNKKLESLYVDVVDEVYIKLIPYKKKYFIKFLDEIKEFIKPTSEVLEIGSYYGVLSDLIKPLKKFY